MAGLGPFAPDGKHFFVEFLSKGGDLPMETVVNWCSRRQIAVSYPVAADFP